MIEFRQVEKNLSLGGVGHRRLFEKDMFACADCTNGPLEVQRIRQWDQNTVNVRVVQDG